MSTQIFAVKSTLIKDQNYELDLLQCQASEPTQRVIAIIPY